MLRSARTRAVSPEKPVEYMWDCIRRYALTGIGHRDLDLTSVLDRANGNGAAGGCKFEGVIDEICEYLCEPVSIRVNRRQITGHFQFEGDVCLCGHRLEFFNHRAPEA